MEFEKSGDSKHRAMWCILSGHLNVYAGLV
jgi:hypothetical protein